MVENLTDQNLIKMVHCNLIINWTVTPLDFGIEATFLDLTWNSSGERQMCESSEQPAMIISLYLQSLRNWMEKWPYVEIVSLWMVLGFCNQLQMDQVFDVQMCVEVKPENIG